jgi:hypothetical protein
LKDEEGIMRRIRLTRLIVSIGSLLLAASFAGGQTPMAGVTLCGPPKPDYLIRVGDAPGHAYGLAQAACRWTTPWEIAGLKSTEGVGTQVLETVGDTTKARGTFVDMMTNGDRAFYSYEYAVLVQSGVPQVQGHKWELLGGTGKLSGVKGRGTCTAKAEGTDGSFRYDCKGEYSLPK